MIKYRDFYIKNYKNYLYKTTNVTSGVFITKYIPRAWYIKNAVKF
jgi:hypothetical protein